MRERPRSRIGVGRDRVMGWRVERRASMAKARGSVCGIRAIRSEMTEIWTPVDRI